MSEGEGGGDTYYTGFCPRCGFHYSFIEANSEPQGLGCRRITCPEHDIWVIGFPRKFNEVTHANPPAND